MRFLLCGMLFTMYMYNFILLGASMNSYYIFTLLLLMEYFSWTDYIIAHKYTLSLT